MGQAPARGWRPMRLSARAGCRVARERPRPPAWVALVGPRRGPMGGAPAEGASHGAVCASRQLWRVSARAPPAGGAWIVPRRGPMGDSRKGRRPMRLSAAAGCRVARERPRPTLAGGWRWLDPGGVPWEGLPPRRASHGAVCVSRQLWRVSARAPPASDEQSSRASTSRPSHVHMAPRGGGQIPTRPLDRGRVGACRGDLRGRSRALQRALHATGPLRRRLLIG